MRYRQAGALTAALTLAVAVTGCTAAPAARGTGDDRTLARVRIGVLPIIDDAPVFIALQHGLFAKQGLDVTPVVLASGEVTTQDLLAGKIQFAFSNYVSTILAATQGAKLRVVADGAQTIADDNAIMIPKNSVIRNVADLRGKTIAVNAAENVGTMMVQSTLLAYGVPANSVKLKVIPFPQMISALQRHVVDAAWMAEPFITESGEQIGAEELASTVTGQMASFPIAGYETLQRYAQQNPATIAAFQRAIAQAQLLAANRSVVERALPTYISGMTPEILAAVHLDLYPASLSPVRLQQVADTMLSAGLITRPFDTAQLLG
jgi:NitT/TauT family transport system substrate-binding protein